MFKNILLCLTLLFSFNVVAEANVDKYAACYIQREGSVKHVDVLAVCQDAAAHVMLLYIPLDPFNTISKVSFSFDDDYRYSIIGSSSEVRMGGKLVNRFLVQLPDEVIQNLSNGKTFILSMQVGSKEITLNLNKDQIESIRIVASIS